MSPEDVRELVREVERQPRMPVPVGRQDDRGGLTDVHGNAVESPTPRREGPHVQDDDPQLPAETNQVR